MVKRLRFLFPPLAIGIGGGVLVASIMVDSFGPHQPEMIVAGLILALGAVVPWSLLRVPWVIYSIRRYNALHQAKHQ